MLPYIFFFDINRAFISHISRRTTGILVIMTIYSYNMSSLIYVPITANWTLFGIITTPYFYFYNIIFA